MLLVDDDEGVLGALRRSLLLHDLDVSAVGSGPAAVDAIRAEHFDVVVLDLRMSPLDGLETFAAIRKLPGAPLAILHSAHLDVPTAVRAVQLGVADVVQKPIGGSAPSQRIRAVMEAGNRASPSDGMSAAGRLQGDSPKMVEIRESVRRHHASEGCGDEPRHAATRRSRAGAAGGSRHLEVRRSGGEYRVALVQGDPVNGHSPSVDVFFDSLAKFVGTNASAATLTGMGADGAAGLLRIRQAGGRTYVQDRESCAVWGMPAAAWEMGAAPSQVPLQSIPAALLADVHDAPGRAHRTGTG